MGFGMDRDGFGFPSDAQLKSDLGGRADFHLNAMLQLSLHAGGGDTDRVVARGKKLSGEGALAVRESAAVEAIGLVRRSDLCAHDSGSGRILYGAADGARGGVLRVDGGGAEHAQRDQL